MKDLEPEGIPDSAVLFLVTWFVAFGWVARGWFR